MTKSISLKDQTSVDKKIDAFCESSSKLLERIHARYGNKAKVASSGINRTVKKKITGEMNIMTDPDVDPLDEELLDGSY